MRERFETVTLVGDRIVLPAHAVRERQVRRGLPGVAGIDLRLIEAEVLIGSRALRKCLSLTVVVVGG